MDTAKMMIYNPQPIKCVEAVFLALYLTAGIFDVERIPLGFKSELRGQVHHHIVLLVRHNGKYGAFGISRQPDLMNKELEFESISSIVNDYKKAYEESQHKVLRIRVGLPVEHNIESFNFVCWRYLSLDPFVSPWEQCVEALEQHVSQAKKLWDRWLLDGQRENKTADMIAKNADLYSISEANGNPRKKLSGSGEQQLGLKVAKKRQALTEVRLPSLRNMSDHVSTSKNTTKSIDNMKMSPYSPAKRSPRHLYLSTKRCSRCHSLGSSPKSVTSICKRSCKMTVKCFSLEMWSGSRARMAKQMDKKKQISNSHRPKKGRQCCVDERFNQTEIIGLPLKVFTPGKPLSKRTTTG